jgi:hypothetical protein
MGDILKGERIREGRQSGATKKAFLTWSTLFGWPGGTQPSHRSEGTEKRPKRVFSAEMGSDGC